MLKRLLSLLLATAVCISLATTVSAHTASSMIYPKNIIEVYSSGGLARNSTSWYEFDLATPYTAIFSNSSTTDGFFTAQSGTEAKIILMLRSNETNIDIGYYTSAGEYIHVPWTKIWNGDVAQYTCEWTFDSTTKFKPFLSNNTAGTITVAITSLYY